jgi:N-acetylglucosamine kinase-like BadF-type ATPase
MRQYVIGVDGGGTKTHYALFDTGGKLVGFHQGGPANHEIYRNGYEGTRQELEWSFRALLGRSGIGIERIEAAVFGLAGLDVAPQRAVLTELIAGMGLRRFQVMNDAFLGIKAAGGSGCGVCSIHGTGTCCAAIDPRGRRLQIGGTGYFFGDEGGAAHLGGMAFRKVYDELYRCGPATAMTGMILEMLRLRRDDDLVEAVYRERCFDNWAQFLKLPFYAANQGDPVALELLRHTGREAAQSVLGAIRRLDFAGAAAIEVIMAGSVYVKGENPALIEAFQRAVREGAGQAVRFTLLRVPPVAGAVLWALEAFRPGLDREVGQAVIQSLAARV